MHVEDGDYVYDEEGNEGIVKNSDDAMQFVINYYEGNGVVSVPDVLQPYMSGMKKIGLKS